MGTLNRDFKWGLQMEILKGILHGDFEMRFVLGFCMEMLNGDFKWGL